MALLSVCKQINYNAIICIDFEFFVTHRQCRVGIVNCDQMVCISLLKVRSNVI
jgi:hypothetical protein